MKIDEKEIAKIAEIARIDLSEDEKAEFSKQLTDMIEYVEKIKALDTSGVEPADNIINLTNVTRDDIVEESPGTDAIEKIAPDFAKGHIVVPRILE